MKVGSRQEHPAFCRKGLLRARKLRRRLEEGALYSQHAERNEARRGQEHTEK